jgi:hypothetical protein
VDIRNTGSFNGRFWVGTPLGDVTGFAAIIQRNAAQLTATGGDVTMQAGGSIVLQKGSTIDVSGGFFRHEGGTVKTTRLLQGGRLVNIADATPNVTYDGIYTGEFTVEHSRWGVSRTFSSTFLSGERFEASYIEGAAGGAIARDGSEHGSRRRLARTNSPRRAAAFPRSGDEFPLDRFLRERIDTSEALRYLTISPTPPRVTFSHQAPQDPADEFTLVGDIPATLRGDRAADVYLSPNLFEESGFGHLTVRNVNGDIRLPAGVHLELPALGSLTVTGANISIGGDIVAPGGRLSFSAQNISPDVIPLLPAATQAPAPSANVGRGLFTLESGALLSTAGLIVDDRPGLSGALTQPLVSTGGSITVEAFSAALRPGSTIDVSGGVVIDSRGRTSFGNGGSIAILTGRDPGVPGVLGGNLELGATLSGYSGARGGTLRLQASSVQVGGATEIPNTLLLQPDFFREGGFTRYQIAGIGALLDEGSPEVPAVPPGENGEPGTPKIPARPALYAPAVHIVAGTTIEPIASSWQASLFGSQETGVTLFPMLKDVGQRSPVSLEFTAIGSDDTFTQSLLEVRGDLVMGAGASISTDPGATVSFRGGTVSILGSVSAPGGGIFVKGDSRFPLAPTAASSAQFPLPTVFIGPRALLSTAGTAVYQPDPYDRRTGRLFDGGTISVAGNVLAAAGAVLDVSGASATFDFHPSILGLFESPIVPVNSGLTSSLWRLRTIPAQVDSNGGLIDLEGSEMLFSDATLLGKAGGERAIGGTLSIFSGRFYAAGESRTGADINLVVTQDGHTIAPGNRELGIGLPVLAASGSAARGRGYFAANTFTRGGFQSLDLGAKYLSGASPIPFGGNVKFLGPVSLSVPGSLRLAAGGIIKSDASVQLSAAYIALGQPFRQPENPNDSVAFFLQSPINPTEIFNPVATAGPGQFTITAGVIDTGTLVTQNISAVTFVAPNGDIRGNGTLSTAGDLHLNAAQVYPTTASEFTIVAYDKTVLVAASSTTSAQVTLASADLPHGFKVGSPLLGSTVQAINGTVVTLAGSANADISAPTAAAYSRGSVTVSRNGSAPQPLSAGGTLSIFASDIRQEGILRAPMGSIQLGWDGKDFDLSDGAFDKPLNRVVGLAAEMPITRRLTLAPGSITSVSAVLPGGEGMLIPFGLSPDGSSWIDPRGVNVTVAGLPEKKITMAADKVLGLGGATVDIRGGGDLYAYRFVLGSGGSADLLGTATAGWSSTTEYQQGDLVRTPDGTTWTARVRHTGEQPSVSPFWTRIADSFAVIPGFESKLAPYAAFNTGLNADALNGDPGFAQPGLAIGARVFLGESEGLDRGTYTLLPRRYALLSGAFLVTPLAQEPIGTVLLPDGASFVPGYTFNAFNTAPKSTLLNARFEVAPADVLRQRAQYDDYFANTLLSEAAERLDVARLQRLPIDSGYAVFSGNNTLRLSNNLLTQRPSGGRGALADISSSADIFLVDRLRLAPDGAQAVLSTWRLNSWGVESLLIGGVRFIGEESTTVHVRAGNLTLNNSASSFAGPEIILAAQDNLTIAPGSTLVQSGEMTTPADTLRPTARVELGAIGDSGPLPQAALP